MKSVALLVALSGLILTSGCRKSEPDEIVSRPRSNTPLPTPVTAGAGGGAPISGTAGTAGAAGGTPSEAECAAPAVVERPFSKTRLLEAAASCAMVHYCRFAARAEQLRDRAAEYAQDPGDGAAEAAKQAWLEANAAWQEAEIFRFGPAAPAPQGRDLRDLIYSWPREVRCKVDEQTVSRFYANTAFFGSAEQSFVSGRSLAAIEYLLFYAGSDNGCTQFSAINASGSWAALVAGGELPQRKADYAAAAAEDVFVTAQSLYEAWDPERGNFHRSLSAPGTAGSEFEDEQAALDAVNYGLFYLEKELKDLKLGIPLGVSTECPAANCPARVESRYASAAAGTLAILNMRANLTGFRRLFQGCGENGAGIGFDDWLTEVGAGELANRMLEALDGVDATMAGLETPLAEAVVSSPERVMAIYDAVKGVSDPLKTEFITILNLELPGPSIGDND